MALDTFLRLLPILNAAIDTCRPYPPSVTYGTDDEIDRIDKGRRELFSSHAFVQSSASTPGGHSTSMNKAPQEAFSIQKLGNDVPISAITR